MLCRVEPVVAWASSFVDGWAPCLLGQEVESRVCFPFTPVDGFAASTCKGLFCRVCSHFYPALSMRAGGCRGRQATLSPAWLEVRSESCHSCHLSRQAQLAFSSFYELEVRAVGRGSRNAASTLKAGGGQLLWLVFIEGRGGMGAWGHQLVRPVVPAQI